MFRVCGFGLLAPFGCLEEGISFGLGLGKANFLVRLS